MNYLGLGLIAFGSVLYWLFGKLVGAIGFQNPYANMPEILRRHPILRYGLYSLPFFVWLVGIVLCFIYSMLLGFGSLAIVVVLWIGLSPLPGQSGASARIIPREISTRSDSRVSRGLKAERKRDPDPDRDQTHKPDWYEFGSIVASTIDAYIAQAGLNSLLKPETAVVMNEDDSISLTQSVEDLKKRRHIKAFVYLKDVGYYEQFKRIQTDKEWANGPMGHVSTDQLAMGVLGKFLEQIPDDTFI